MIIYKVTNKINGKCYIGQTTNKLSSRKAKHIFEALNRNSNFIFHKAIRKYGKKNFKWKILYKCDSCNELNEKEEFYIEKYKSYYGYGNGYNMTYGGNCSGMKGKKHTEETKEKLRNHTHTEDTIEKIRESSRENYKDKKNFTMLGKSHSSKTKKKMSESSKKYYKIKKLAHYGLGGKKIRKVKKAIMNGEEIYITNLVQWAKDNNYPYQQAMYRIKNGIDLSKKKWSRV